MTAGHVAGTRQKGFKAELDGLRERMGDRGFSHHEIAAEIGRRYRVRPREGYRLAWGWSLEKAAGRFNDYAAGQETDAEGRASLTASRLSEFEHWPQTARKPSVHALVMLAGIYQADALCLLDFADHESLPQQDLLVLRRRPQAETPYGEKAVALTEAGGLLLSLPYVPGRLVIEVSGPAGDAAVLAAGADEVAGGRLRLVSGMGGADCAR